MSKKLTWGGAILLAVSLIFLVAFLGNITSGFQDFDKDSVVEKFEKKLNTDNLYTSECVSLVDTNNGNGVSVNVDEKTGAIVLNGKAESDASYIVGTVTLSAGEYTLTAIEGATTSTVYMTASYDSIVEYFDFTPNNTITIEADNTVVTLTLYVKADTQLSGVNVLPVIVEGAESADFYS